ncbi:MAG: DUF1638 domain-containing protein [Spirochaetales bacterium]|nr:DUF1638 domain-containing protein [Spirochaetales bacterium]
MDFDGNNQDTESSRSFSDICIVSCGILKADINHLQDNGFINAKKILFTAPGLHEWQPELKKQLVKQLKTASTVSDKILVLYGQRCFMDPGDPSRVTDVLIKEECPGALRIKAANCVDMLTDLDYREKTAGSKKVYWITPGWLKHWDYIFKDWDKGKANEMFPQHDKIMVADAIGYYEKLMIEDPEKILKISDWTAVPIESVNISFNRFKSLLEEGAKILNEGNNL